MLPTRRAHPQQRQATLTFGKGHGVGKRDVGGLGECGSRQGESEGGGGTQEDRATSGVLGLPFGRYLVFAAAAGFVGAALFNGYRAVTCNFRKKLETERMSKTEETAATASGTLPSQVLSSRAK